QRRPEVTAPATPPDWERITARRNRHADPRRAMGSPMPLTYPRMGVSIEQRFPRPSVMGVVNVTPDWFSDGGVNIEPAKAGPTARARGAEGAASGGIGGESTRPGASAVGVDDELRRVLPVLEQLDGV